MSCSEIAVKHEIFEVVPDVTMQYKHLANKQHLSLLRIKIICTCLSHHYLTFSTFGIPLESATKTDLFMSKLLRYFFLHS